MRNKRIIGNTNDQYCNISGCQCIDHAVGYQYFAFHLINDTRDLKLGMHTHTHLFLWGAGSYMTRSLSLGGWVPHGHTSSSWELGPTWPHLFLWGGGGDGFHMAKFLPLGSWVLHGQISFSGGWVPHGHTSSSGCVKKNMVVGSNAWSWVGSHLETPPFRPITVPNKTHSLGRYILH